MVLVFGGTTEGRKAVEVLEEAGSCYYYSTRGAEQQMDLVHGVLLKGTMDEAKMVACCREHDIRLLVDAAHPFAETLHRNILSLAARTGIPLIRYDRIYPPRSEDLIWCRDYDDAIQQMEARGVHRLLALTGVNTIGRLSRFWRQHDCWFRILNRDTSKELARQHLFPEERLVYYEHDDTAALLVQLQPQAILTKESGVSGGFEAKVDAARAAGVAVFVVQRPPYPPAEASVQKVVLTTVNGPHGLRRAVERLLPTFYPLHSGLTTGTCATAAAVAAARRLLRNETPPTVPVLLPDGETIDVPVSYGDGYASCVKVAGDDPDVTDGLEIRASVQPSERFEIRGDEGVGTITLPGFDFPPGEPAINKTPREMIRQNLSSLIPHPSSFIVTISVPEGREVARRTFNPRLGIEGGVSIIGVSGIVKPFSEEAFIDSIRKCMTVAKASGSERVVIHSGAKSAGVLRQHEPTLPQQAFVEYGNAIGETLKIASELAVPHVILGIMLGKAVKLAAGQLDTHSRRTVMDKAFVQQMLHEARCDADVSHITLARELWNLIPRERLQDFATTIIRHCAEHCEPLLPNGLLTILLIDDEGNIYGKEI